jgi:GNAT superfamily N-acetyltransferase
MGGALTLQVLQMSSTNNITYGLESFDDLLEELKPLNEDHYHEIAMYQDSVELNPRYDVYSLLQSEGSLKIYTVRDSLELVGYFILVVAAHMHYKDHLFATTDIIYIDEQYRNKRVGFELISFAEKDLANEGVSVMILNTKCKKPFYELCEGLGYDKIEVVYGKLLKSGEE